MVYANSNNNVIPKGIYRIKLEGIYNMELENNVTGNSVTVKTSVLDSLVDLGYVEIY